MTANPLEVTRTVLQRGHFELGQTLELMEALDEGDQWQALEAVQTQMRSVATMLLMATELNVVPNE